MKNTKKLNNQELTKSSGGSFFKNKYERWVYHDAGITISHLTFRWDQFFFTMPYDQLNHMMYHDEANKYVDYYLSHTPAEYIAFVQQIIPQYNEIIKGHDTK